MSKFLKLDNAKIREMSFMTYQEILMIWEQPLNEMKGWGWENKELLEWHVLILNGHKPPL